MLEPGPKRAELEDATTYEDVELGDEDFSGLRMHSVDWRGGRLTNVDLSDAELQGGGLTDVQLDRCALTNVRARGAAMRRTNLTESSITGLTWSDGLLFDSVLEDCRGDFASLRFSKIERTLFRRCRLDELDLHRAQLTSVVFEDCDLTGADFSQARFNRCEVLGCKMERIQGVADLRGVAMRWSDILGLAGTLAATLGLSIVDESDPA